MFVVDIIKQGALTMKETIAIAMWLKRDEVNCHKNAVLSSLTFPKCLLFKKLEAKFFAVSIIFVEVFLIFVA